MFGALKRGFRSMASLILVRRNVVGELRPKRTLAASRGFLAAARLSCMEWQRYLWSQQSRWQALPLWCTSFNKIIVIIITIQQFIRCCHVVKVTNPSTDRAHWLLYCCTGTHPCHGLCLHICFHAHLDQRTATSALSCNGSKVFISILQRSPTVQKIKLNPLQSPCNQCHLLCCTCLNVATILWRSAAFSLSMYNNSVFLWFHPVSRRY